MQDLVNQSTSERQAGVSKKVDVGKQDSGGIHALSRELNRSLSVTEYSTIKINAASNFRLVIEVNPKYQLSMPFGLSEDNRNYTQHRVGYNRILPPGTYYLSVCAYHRFRFLPVSRYVASNQQNFQVDALSSSLSRKQIYADYPWIPWHPNSTRPSEDVWRSWVQTALDVIGFIPVLGNAADLANACIHFAYNENLLGLLSLISCVDGLGHIAGAVKLAAAAAGASVTVATIAARLGPQVMSVLRQSARLIRDCLNKLHNYYDKFSKEFLLRAEDLLHKLLDAPLDALNKSSGRYSQKYNNDRNANRGTNEFQTSQANVRTPVPEGKYFMFESQSRNYSFRNSELGEFGVELLKLQTVREGDRAIMKVSLLRGMQADGIASVGETTNSVNLIALAGMFLRQAEGCTSLTIHWQVANQIWNSQRFRRLCELRGWKLQRTGISDYMKMTKTITP